MSFHLSLPVRSLPASVEFFVQVLGARVTHEDESGYVNVLLGGAQITLREGDVFASTDFHFGVNVSRVEFDALAGRIVEQRPDCVVSEPAIVDEGTPLERTKMYVRCPSGYLIELKGVRDAVAHG